MILGYIGLLVHPFFVSMTDIRIITTRVKELEISVRIFTDDLEESLRKYHNTKIIILFIPLIHQQMNDFVNELHIQNIMQLRVNEKLYKK